MNLRKQAHEFYANTKKDALPGQTAVPSELTPEMATIMVETLQEAQALLDKAFGKEGRESLEEMVSLIVTATASRNPMLSMSLRMSPIMVNFVGTMFAVGYGLCERDHEAAAQFENLLLKGK